MEKTVVQVQTKFSIDRVLIKEGPRTVIHNKANTLHCYVSSVTSYIISVAEPKGNLSEILIKILDRAVEIVLHNSQKFAGDICVYGFAEPVAIAVVVYGYRIHRASIEYSSILVTHSYLNTDLGDIVIGAITKFLTRYKP